MNSTQRATLKIWILGALVLGGLLFAAGAEANGRHRGERINDHLGLFAFVAAISGDYGLAYRLDRRGDRIELRYEGHHRRHESKAHSSRKAHRRHHRHVVGCGHGEIRHRVGHENRSQRRGYSNRHDQRYDDRRRHSPQSSRNRAPGDP
jgi:hypothetical protein